MGTLQRLGDYVCSPTVPPAFDPRPLVRLESSSRSLLYALYSRQSSTVLHSYPGQLVTSPFQLALTYINNVDRAMMPMVGAESPSQAAQSNGMCSLHAYWQYQSTPMVYVYHLQIAPSHMRWSHCPRARKMPTLRMPDPSNPSHRSSALASG